MKKKKIAAIFAHPDDEVLGCGAALAQHVASGDIVNILILATGLSSRGSVEDEAIIDLRKQARQSADILGVDTINFLDFPDNQMDSIPLLKVVHDVECFLRKFPADLIYTHHAGDLNVDHRVTHQAVLTACRPMPACAPLEILGCEVNSSTEWSVPPLAPFLPNIFLNVASGIKNKLQALSCYVSELRDWPHPRSVEGVEALARWRGAQSGFEAAEAFVQIRKTSDSL